MALFFINKYIYFISDRNQLLKRANYLGVVIWSWEGIIHPNGSTLYQARKLSCHVFVLGISIFASFYDFSIRFCNCSENEKWAVMYLCSMYRFLLFSTLFVLNFGNVSTVWHFHYFLIYYNDEFENCANVVLLTISNIFILFCFWDTACIRSLILYWKPCFFFKSWRPYLKS